MNRFQSESRVKRSFGEVAQEHLATLLRVATRMTRNETLAEDLVGQTILSAHKHWDDFDGKHALSWMIKLMTHEWMNQIRKNKVRATVNIDAGAEPVDENFWREVETGLDVQSINEALDSLPDEYRITVTLCDVEEMTYEEAALAMQIPVGTVRSRLFRGRKILRSKLVLQTD